MLQLCLTKYDSGAPSLRLTLALSTLIHFHFKTDKTVLHTGIAKLCRRWRRCGHFIQHTDRYLSALYSPANPELNYLYESRRQLRGFCFLRFLSQNVRHISFSDVCLCLNSVKPCGVERQPGSECMSQCADWEPDQDFDMFAAA